MKLQKLIDSAKNQKIAFIGTGVSHRQAILKFAKLGANLQVLDKNPLSEEFNRQLQDLGVQVKTGKHYLDELDAQIYFKTPGLPFESEEVKRIRRAKKVVTSELEVFFKLCGCKIIGVTGSDGKTTTTTIIHKILSAAGARVHLGGNIGLPLLPYVDEILENDIVVVELSSFQLESMRCSPEIAVITNLTPNHLNVHKTMENYLEAKSNIVKHQDGFSRLVLNQKDSFTPYFASLARGRVEIFGNNTEVCVKNGGVYAYGTKVMDLADIKLKGTHNLENYLAAIAAVWGLAGPEDILAVAREFGGVEHRIEFCGEADGVRFFNDSIATTPLRTETGLAMFEEPVVLIAGGSDKGLQFESLGDTIAKKVKCLVLMGDTAPKIEAAVRGSEHFEEEKTKIEAAETMEEAVEIAVKNSKAGDVVLLSPACASFDKFTNFEARGRAFKDAVRTKIREGERKR